MRASKSCASISKTSTSRSAISLGTSTGQKVSRSMTNINKSIGTSIAFLKRKDGHSRHNCKRTTTRQLRCKICWRRLQSMTSSSPLFNLLRPQSNIPSRNALVSPRPSLTRHRPPSAMGTWISRSPSSTTWSPCALARNGVLENPVNRGRTILRQARRMTTRLMLISNWNVQILTPHLDVNSHSNAGLSNVCMASATSRCPYANDNISSAVTIRCNATSIGTITFSLARTAHSPMTNVGSLPSKASCTLKITQRMSTESTCLTNASIRHLSFQWIMISIRAIFNHCPTAAATWCSCCLSWKFCGVPMVLKQYIDGMIGNVTHFGTITWSSAAVIVASVLTNYALIPFAG